MLVPAIEQVIVREDGIAGEPIDGWLVLYDHTHGEEWRFPFRRPEKGGLLIDEDTGQPPDGKPPIWEWVNPDDPPERITLHPSIHFKDRFHVTVKDGGVHSCES